MEPRALSLVVLGVCVLPACGGKLDNGDAGAQPDSSTTEAGGADAPFVDVVITPACGATQTSSENGLGSCHVTKSWSCGETQYSVVVTCPPGRCDCTQMGSTVSYKEISAPELCPNTCTGASFATACGFPPGN